MNGQNEPSRSSAPSSPRSRRRLIFALVGIGLLTAVAIGCYNHFLLARPQGKGPAGPTMQREAFAHSWTSRPVLLVGLGDSVTAGFGARHGYGYFERLATNPAEDWTEMKGICLS